MAFRILSLIFVFAWALAPPPAAADVLGWLIDRAIGEGEVPACQDPAVFDRIRSKLRTADKHIFQNRLAIVTISDTHETRFTYYEPSPVARRYCKATARLTDGKQPALFYLIEQRLGFVGVTWNVEFCMPGYDPYRAYGGACEVLRR